MICVSYFSQGSCFCESCSNLREIYFLQSRDVTAWGLGKVLHSPGKLYWALVIKYLYLSPWTQMSNQSQTEAPNFLKIMLLEALKSVTDQLSSFLYCQLVLHIILYLFDPHKLQTLQLNKRHLRFFIEVILIAIICFWARQYLDMFCQNLKYTSVY